METIFNLANELNDNDFSKVRLKNSNKIISIITWCQILVIEIIIRAISINMIPINNSILEMQFTKHSINVKIRINFKK